MKDRDLNCFKSYIWCISKRISKYGVQDKKTGLIANVNEELAQELHKPVIKKIQKKDSLCRV